MVKRRMAPWLALYAALAPAAGWAETPAAENWTPISRTAQSVTGRVTLAPGQITFQNGKSLQLVRGGQMLFRPDKKHKKVMADLYRVAQQEDLVLENGNKLCGTKNAAYLVVWKSDKLGAEADPRTMAVFSGPKFDPGSRDECGRFGYDAGAR